MNVLISIDEFQLITEVISFRNLHIIKVQKSKLIKNSYHIIALRTSTHRYELIKSARKKDFLR